MLLRLSSKNIKNKIAAVEAQYKRNESFKCIDYVAPFFIFPTLISCWALFDERYLQALIILLLTGAVFSTFPFLVKLEKETLILKFMTKEKRYNINDFNIQWERRHGKGLANFDLLITGKNTNIKVPISPLICNEYEVIALIYFIYYLEDLKIDKANYLDDIESLRIK